MSKPTFNSDCEKYEWLMKHGCTNPDERNWVEEYIKSDEYFNLYEVENYEENIC